MTNTHPIPYVDGPKSDVAQAETQLQTAQVQDTDIGRRRATSETAMAGFDVAAGDYRELALAAFPQVEDNLAALRILEAEAGQQHQAVISAQESLQLFSNRYKGGVDTYLRVVTSQTAALTNERNETDIQRRRMDATVLLIKALGGGWNVSNLPKLWEELKIMRTMRAEGFRGYQDLKLVDIPKPHVSDGRVLVKITAAGVTPLEHTILSGGYPRAKAPLVLGSEGAGVVEDANGSEFSDGARVMFTGPYGVSEDGPIASTLPCVKKTST